MIAPMGNSLDRRKFLMTTATAGAAAATGWFATSLNAAPATTATVLYGEHAVTLEKIRPDEKDLWVRAADLPSINEFHVKPQGACREDLCIPIPTSLKKGEYINLTGFARRTGEAFIKEG